MPVVPAAGYPTGPDAPPQPVPLAPPEDYQRIQATPEAFGAQVGQSMSALGRVLTKSADEFQQVAIERQQLHNNVVSDNAINNYTDHNNKLLYGDPNAPPGSPEAVGYFGLRGQAALDARPKIRDALLSSREQMRNQLENPMQQLKFDQETRRQLSMDMARVGSHYDQQYDVFQTETNKAGGVLARQKMDQAALANDDAAFNAAVGGAMDWGMKQLQAQGLGNDQNAIWAMQGQIREDAVDRRIKGYIGTGNTDAAARILTQESGPGGALSAQKAAEYRKILDNIEADRAAQRHVQPGSGAMGGVGPVTPQQVADAAARNGTDPLLANATAAIESSHGANAGSPTKKYAGVFQMGPDERESVGGNADSIGTLEEQVEQGTKLLAKRKQELAASLGREPTNAEVYLAHQQGVVGATKLINNPNTPAGQLVPGINISSNAGDPNAPASAFVQHWQQVYNQTEARFKGVTPAAAPTAATGAAAPGATPAPATTPPPQAAATTPGATPAKLEVWGDSLGVGVRSALKIGGGHVVGSAQPVDILADVKGEPEDSWTGKTVVLSSGSNGRQMDKVEETIRYLQDHNANVIVVGYGTDPKAHLTEKNAQLREIAGRLKVPVVDAEQVGSDGVHPGGQGYQRMADKIRAAAGGGSAQPATAPEGAIISSPGKPTLQNVGGKWVPYMPEGT